MRQLLNRALVVAACAIAIESGAGEQTFYKSVLPNGRVVYGDAPAEGAKRSQKVTVQTDVPSPDANAARRALEMSRAQLLRNAAARDARLTQLEGEISAAYAAHKAAEQEREAGREIQESDRQGRRLLPQYAERQRALVTAVKQTQQVLDKLLSERAALR